MDFSLGAEIFPKIVASVEDLDVGILGEIIIRKLILSTLKIFSLYPTTLHT